MNYIRHLNTFFFRVKSDPQLSCHHISLYLALFQYWNYHRFESPFPVYRDNLMQLSKVGSKNTYHKCIKQLQLAGYIRYHPAINKYTPAKVSMRRLDQFADATDSPQLHLFDPQNSAVQCPKTDTHSVPLLTGSRPINGTHSVPKVGHIIKQVNYIQTNSVLENTHTENPKKNNEEKEEKKLPAAGSNPVQQNPTPQHGLYQAGEEGGRMLVPTFSEIELFFQRNGYPVSEAQKFWLYNRGRGWMLSDNAPIWNWQPLAHKWMLNTRQDGSKVSGDTSHLKTQTDKNYDEPL